MNGGTHFPPSSVRHDRHRHGFQTRDEQLLDLPEAQPIIARIAANVDPTFPRRRAHIESVATVVIRAKKRPNNAYARPTL